MKKHKIGWLNVPGYIPQTWNPIVGCSKISEGCRNCYAEQWACRLANMALNRQPGTRQYLRVCEIDPHGKPSGWTGKTTLVPDALEKPLHWKAPRAIFVNSMGDLFHESTPDEWIDRVFAIMALCPQHLFIVLTKRAERMERYFSDRDTVCRILNEKMGAAIDNAISCSLLTFSLPLPNVWLGVTAENQSAAEERIPHLLQAPADVRFVSCEPLIGPVTFRWNVRMLEAATGMKYREILESRGSIDQHDALRELDWVICGGESGPGARPMNPEWSRSLRDQCQTAGVPFFFKQWGSARGQKSEAGGQKGGDFLDGKQWHQLPTL